MRFSFSGNLNYYYHEFHGIENSFHHHDYNHVLVHVHGFETISHSLQGIVQIQLDEIGDFSSKAHYFAYQQVNKKTLYQFRVFIKSTLSILLLQEHIRGMKCGERFF